MDGQLRFFSVSEVASMYSVSPDKIYRDIKRGFLPAVSVGKIVRVRESDAKGYAKELTPGPTPLIRRSA